MLNPQQIQFRNKIMALAREIAPAHGIDWRLMAAAAILESGWGQSELARKACNYFGMTALPSTPPGQVWRIESSGGPHRFRRYETEAESFHHYGRLLARSSLYAKARQAGLLAFIEQMAPVYCPDDPDYGLKLRQIMRLLPETKS